MLLQQATKARLWYQDNDGAIASCECNFAPSLSFEDIFAYISVLTSRIGALVSTTLVRVEYVYTWIDPTYAQPEADSDNLLVGAFFFDTADSEIYAIRLHGIGQHLIAIDGPMAGIAIDTDYPEVDAFINAVISGISGTQPCDKFGYDLVSFNTAYIEQLQ